MKNDIEQDSSWELIFWELSILELGIIFFKSNIYNT